MGADGANSRLRKLLAVQGILKNEEKSGLATAMEISVPQEMAPTLPDYPVIYFGHIRWGYAWCFPRNRLRILGICALNKKSGKSARHNFQHFLKSIQLSPDIISTAKSHPLPYGNYLETPGSGNILLLGDAAGLADPLLGEGIYYAHKSGQLAARAAIQSLRDSQEAIRFYTRDLAADIISELKFAWVGRQIIFSLPGSWPALLINHLLQVHHRICEEVIQGQRSFRWFHSIKA
jgi:flavin-dependent dehydrogenase